MQRIHSAVGVGLLMLLTSTSVSAEDKKPADEKITYEQHILPILREKCGTCHNPSDKNGDLALDNYQSALQGGASGEVIRIDGDAENSKLYRVVSHLSEPFMPPEQPKLPDAQIALIKKWIEQGALQNAGSPARPKKANVTRVEVTTERPPGPPPMPEGLSIDPVLVSQRANGVTAMASNPWSPLVAVSGHQQVFLYNTATLELAGVLPFPEGQPHIMKFSRNGAMLLVGGGRGAHSGKVVLFDVKTGERKAEVGDEYDVVLAADLSPDQTMVALGGPKKVVRCYSVETGDALYEMKKHTDWITTLEFSPDGVLLATGDRSNGLIVWEAQTGREFYALNGHTAAVTDVSWAPDSNVLASASEDGTVRLWEMQNGTQVKNWGAHGGGTLAMDFSRDARIVSAGRDQRGKLWDSAGIAQKTYEPGLADLGTAATLCAETDRVLIGDLTGVVHVYQAKDGVKVGELTTNPPALTARIELTQKQLQADEAAAMQTAAQVAALARGITERKTAAEAAQKAASDAAAAAAAANQAKTAADADLVAKRKSETEADTQLKAVMAEHDKAVAEASAAEKSLTEALARLKTSQQTVATAKANSDKANETLQAKSDDPELKQAADAALKALAEAEEVAKQAAAGVATAEGVQQTRQTALTTATTKLESVKKSREQAVAARVTAEKQVAATVTGLQSAVAMSNTRKEEAARAVAAAQATPEQQKQLTDAEAAAKSAADKLAVTKDRLTRLQAGVGASTGTAAK